MRTEKLTESALVVHYEARCLRCGTVATRSYLLPPAALPAAKVVELDRAFMADVGFAFVDAPHDGFCPSCLARLAFALDHRDGVELKGWAK